jgi:hypothetical protein
LVTKAQTKEDIDQMPRRAIGLTANELPIVQKGLSQIPKDAYAYLAIHADGSLFKIFENTSWNLISHKSLAKWIADNRAYDGRDVILLSCNDAVSSQNLANALGELDKVAKRKSRKIIAWDGKVHIYSNGYIMGRGACKGYALAVNPILLQGDKIPIGKPNSSAAATE